MSEVVTGELPKISRCTRSRAAGSPISRRIRLPFNHENQAFSNAELAEQEPIPEPKTKAFLKREGESGIVSCYRSSLSFDGSTVHAGMVRPHNKLQALISPGLQIPVARADLAATAAATATTDEHVGVAEVSLRAALYSDAYTI